MQPTECSGKYKSKDNDDLIVYSNSCMQNRLCLHSLHLLIQYSGNSSQIEATKDDTMRFHTSSLSPTLSMGNYHCARVSELSQVCNVHILVCFI